MTATEQVFENYIVDRLLVKARKSLGGAFYELILPDGKKMSVVAWAFESVATKAPDPLPDWLETLPKEGWVVGVDGPYWEKK